MVILHFVLFFRENTFAQQRGDCQQQSQKSEGDPEVGGCGIQRLVANIDEDQRAGDDAYGGTQQVSSQGDIRKAKGVIDQVIWDSWDQTKYDEKEKAAAPAVGKKPLLPGGGKLAAEKSLDFFASCIAGEKEHQRTIEHRPKKGVDASPEQTEEKPASQSKDGYGKKEYRQQRKKKNVTQRSQGTAGFQECLQILGGNCTGTPPGEGQQSGNKERGNDDRFFGLKHGDDLLPGDMGGTLADQSVQVWRSG